MRSLLNLGEVLARGDREDRLALVDLEQPERPREVRLSELEGLADAAARGLVARGHARGDRIGIAAGNSLRFLVAYLGSLRAGLVCVPINHRVPPEIVRFICRDAQVSAVFADAAGRARCPDDVQILGLEDEALEALLDPGPFEPVRPEPDETAILLYTSGSTGRPKGVILSHRSQWAIVNSMSDPAVRGALEGRRGIVAAPLFHMNGLVFCEVMLHIGGTIVLLPRFTAPSFIEAVERHRVNVITGVPTMLALMAREADLVAKSDLSSVEVVFVGSAPLSSVVVEQARAMFPKALLVNGYGTTETGAGTFGAHPDGLPRPQMSIGYPAPHAEVRLANGPGAHEGVLELRSPSNMTGYQNLPELTAAKTVDGWINTGDVMRRDADGFYYFVGRADDMFVCSGENIYPGEVEKLLEGHPDVLQSCVVPVDDAVRGQMPVAFIVARPDRPLTEQQVRDFALAGGPAYLHPRRVFFVEQLPLAGTNKVDRHALIERARSGAGTAGARRR